MAYIATVQLLVDEPTPEDVRENLERLFENAQVTSVDQTEDDGTWLVDWVFDEIQKAPEDVDDAITNDMYEEGDAFEDLGD
jgi:hypothetical protein